MSPSVVTPPPRPSLCDWAPSLAPDVALATGHYWPQTWPWGRVSGQQPAGTSRHVTSVLSLEARGDLTSALERQDSVPSLGLVVLLLLVCPLRQDGELGLRGKVRQTVMSQEAQNVDLWNR